MTKILKAKFPEKCIGCELCILEMQRQINKIGFEGSVIRILKKPREDTDGLEYSIVLDPQVNKFDIKKIKEICPTQVFTIENQENGLIS